MDVIYEEKTGRKGLISTTWKRCKSIGSRRKTMSPAKSRSWPRIRRTPAEEEEEKNRRKRRVAPEGCFSVYVGDKREKFIVKAEFANHPLFQILLEEAESEYGYNSQGPIWLPCEVHIFLKVLVEMGDDGCDIRYGCGYSLRHGSHHLLGSSRSLPINQF